MGWTDLVIVIIIGRHGDPRIQRARYASKGAEEERCALSASLGRVARFHDYDT